MCCTSARWTCTATPTAPTSPRRSRCDIRSRTRAIVLDGAFSLGGFDPWERNESADLRAAWRAVCARWGNCSNILGEITQLAAALDAKPLAAVVRDADGTPHHVRMDGASLAQLTVDASSSYSIYRDLAAAGRAYMSGRAGPLLRLAGEDLAQFENGPPRWYSLGALQAVVCHDYPTIWNRSATIATRRAQVATARAGLAANVFSPFSKADWLRSEYQHELVYGCLLWPRAPVADPARPPGARIPNVPVLVLNGDLDTLTPSSDAAAAARFFPNSTLVRMRNVGHVSALADFDGCASGIVRRFLTTLSAGDTSCASQVEQIHTVPQFPLRLAGVAKPNIAGKAAWAAGEVAADALARWWIMYGYYGHGLRRRDVHVGGAVSQQATAGHVHPASHQVRVGHGRQRQGGVGSHGADDDRSGDAHGSGHRASGDHLAHQRPERQRAHHRHGQRARGRPDHARAVALAVTAAGGIIRARAAGAGRAAAA